jgi:hypothetical protein
VPWSDDPCKASKPPSVAILSPLQGEEGAASLLTASSTFTGSQEPYTSTVIWIELCPICCMT